MGIRKTKKVTFFFNAENQKICGESFKCGFIVGRFSVTGVI